MGRGFSAVTGRSAGRAGALLAGLLALCALAAPPAAATRVGFWAGEEFRGQSGFDTSGRTYFTARDTSYFTPALWHVLQRYHVPLYLHLRYGRDFGPVPKGEHAHRDALPLARKAQSLGVPVWAWIVIPYPDGYFAWDDAAQQELAALSALRAWERQSKLRLVGVALDPEPSTQWIAGFYAATGGSGAGDFASLVNKSVDPAAQCDAIRSYNHVYRSALAQFRHVVAAPFPLALDDFEDGSIALQDAMDFWGAPRYAQVLHFQAYRTVLAQLFGADPGSAVVASYFNRAQQLFGPRRGQVTVGIPGGPGYEHVEALVRDLRLLAALGAADVPIYSLELAVKYYGVSGVAALVRAGGQPLSGAEAQDAAATNPNNEAVHAAIRAFDATATAATVPVTTRKGNPQLPNDFPSGCAGAE